MSARHRTASILILALAFTACRTAPSPATRPAGSAATVQMRSTSGGSLGGLRLDRTSTGVRITGVLTGIPSGPHGIHFHQVGRCERPDFESAGSHVNPTNALHGLESPLGPHAGDLPNVSASAAGQVAVDLTTSRVSLDAGAPGWLFDADGTALVIHASADDQRSDPTGNTGARIACGVIERG